MATKRAILDPFLGHSPILDPVWAILDPFWAILYPFWAILTHFGVNFPYNWASPKKLGEPDQKSGQGVDFPASQISRIVFILSPAQSIFSTKTSPKSPFSLQQLPQKVDFLYTNIPPKSHFSGKVFQKNRSSKPRVRPAVPTRRPAPTLLYQRLT